MLEKEVFVTTKYGLMPSFAVCPAAPGTFPAIIFYMDAPGYREELKDMARRIARHGYFCLLPDLYYRLGTLRFDVARRDGAMSTVIRAAMASLTNATVMDDTAGMIAFLDGQEKVSPGPLACVGHCMSGAFVTLAAARFASRMAAAASLYGLGIVTDGPDSPHRELPQVKGELYFAFAEVDPGVPPAVVPSLEAAAVRAGVRATIKTVAGTHHGFCFPARPDYSPAAAEATWAELFGLWDRNLVGR